MRALSAALLVAPVAALTTDPRARRRPRFRSSDLSELVENADGFVEIGNLSNLFARLPRPRSAVGACRALPQRFRSEARRRGSTSGKGTAGKGTATFQEARFDSSQVDGDFRGEESRDLGEREHVSTRVRKLIEDERVGGFSSCFIPSLRLCTFGNIPNGA
jgi:hypothetical protein